MDSLDGKEVNGSKLQVTQVFHLLNNFKQKFKMRFRQTKLGLIKESEDSDDPDPNSSQEKYEIEGGSSNSLINFYKNESGNVIHEDDWRPPDNQTYYQNPEADPMNSNFIVYEQPEYEMSQSNQYMMNANISQNNMYNNFTANQRKFQINNNLLNNSSSSIGKVDNYSISEENEHQDGFNRTQSVRLYPNVINSGALTSRLNSSYESGIQEDEDLRHSSRSYVSSGSFGSNPNFNSTCARTYTSSGGMIDHSNSQMQLTYDMQQMHSSFDLGNDPAYNSYRLTPRQMSDYSYKSNQAYDPNFQFNSFQMYKRNQINQYGPISCGNMNKMRNCLSFTNLNDLKAHSNPSDNFGNSSFNSTYKFNKNSNNNDSTRGFRKRCPAQDEDEAVYKINIDNIIEGKDNRTTLMIRNIPNKYTGKSLRNEINKSNKDRYDYFYLPIDFSNKCNMGYAFINFIHRAYILDFYYQYNDKNWTMYNSEKVCKITYGRIQGKDQLVSHLKDKKVLKSHNNNVKPLIMNTKRVNENEIREILDKYYRRRFKEKAEISDKKNEESKDGKGVHASGDKVQLSTGSSIPESIESIKVEIRNASKDAHEKEKTGQQSSQDSSPTTDKLDKQEQVKRPASIGEKASSSEDEKKGTGHEIDKISKKLKIIHLKNICKTSRGNFNSSN